MSNHPLARFIPCKAALQPAVVYTNGTQFPVTKDFSRPPFRLVWDVTCAQVGMARALLRHVAKETPLEWAAYVQLTGEIRNQAGATIISELWEQFTAANRALTGKHVRVGLYVVEENAHAAAFAAALQLVLEVEAKLSPSITAGELDTLLDLVHAEEGEATRRVAARERGEHAPLDTIAPVQGLQASSTGNGTKGLKTIIANRDPKLEARDKWIYKQCCKGREMPYAQIIANLERFTNPCDIHNAQTSPECPLG